MRLPPRWVVAVSFAVAAAILGDSLLYAVLPTVWPQLGLEVGLVGVLLSANRFVRLVSNPLAGWAMGRLGVRGPFLAAVFVAAVTTAAYAAGLGFFVLLVARALWGVCWSFLRLGGYLAALEAATAGNRGYYLGFFNGVTRFGSFVAVLAGGFLTDLVGFETTVALFTALTVLGGLAVLRERPPQPVHVNATQPEVKAPDSTDGVQPSGAKSSADPGAVAAATRRDTTSQWASTERQRHVVYVTAFLQGFALNGLVIATLGLWLLTAYGATPRVLAVPLGVATLTGILLGARFLLDFLWGPVAGHLSDRYGRVPSALAAGTIEIGGLFALALPDGLLWTVGVAIVIFLASTALQVTLDAQVGGLAPTGGRARTMSWHATWLDLGSAIGPLAGYLVSESLGLGWLYWIAAAALAGIGLVYLATFAGELHPRPVISTAR
ncbi:MAG: MFS transporter [Chloroflexi bacterium]|nr:MFS transporter [Chloroflexota bacterium]